MSESLQPTFGRPPPGAPDPTRFSLPAFLPPPGMLNAEIFAANDDVASARGTVGHALPAFSERAMVFDPPPAPTLDDLPRRAPLPALLVFGMGVVAGVIVTLLLT